MVIIKNNNNILIENHRHEGVLIARGKEDCIVTISLTPGQSVYGEKRFSLVFNKKLNEYRIWNPFRSKLAAAILAGIDHIHIKYKSKILYLGASTGTTVSHCSDIVGRQGVIYAVEFSHRCARDLLELANKRNNIVPILEDARFPHKFRILVSVVDAIIIDIAQPDQTRILALNAEYFLRKGGGYLLSVKANCVDSTSPPEAIYAREINKLFQLNLRPREQVTLEPYERNHAFISGVYYP